LSITPELRTQRSRFRSELWVRSFRFPQAPTYTSLANKALIDPIDVDLREAYFEVFDFLVNGLDVRIGRQRHVWGTADKLNPTDNLNPYDLEDIWDFGRHLASNSIRLSYYWRDFTLSGVFIPYFSPLHAPDTSVMAAFLPEVNFPATTELNGNQLRLIYGAINDVMHFPERHIKNAVYGFRLEKPIGGFNTSVSYMKGYDVLPSPYSTIVEPTNIIFPDTIKVDVISHLRFARQDIIGLDIAGAIRNVGVWGEAALFMPEKITNETYIDLGNNNMISLQDSVVVEDKAFLKFIVGMDYTFFNGMYLNFQYLHGFFHERHNELNDYFVWAFDIPAFRERVRFSPLNGTLMISNWDNISDNYGLVMMPEISYSGIDNANFSIGARIIEGSDNTLFGRMKTHRDIFIKLNYAF